MGQKSVPCEPEIEGQARLGVCGKAMSRGGPPADRTALAVAQDIDSFGAFLNVCRDFGCVPLAPRARV